MTVGVKIEQQPVQVVSTLGRARGKVLGTSDPAATTNTNLYTVPQGFTTEVTVISVCNRSGVTITVRVGIDVGGNGTNAPSDAEWIYFDLGVAANSTTLLDAAQGLWLSSRDDLVVFASASDAAFITSGLEFEECA